MQRRRYRPNNQLSLYRPRTHGATSRAWVARAAMDLGSWEGSSRSAGSVALIFTVLRPMVRYSTSYAPPAIAASGTINAALQGPDQEGANNQEITALTAPPPELPPVAPKPNYQQSLAMARNSANEQPVRAAYVVKNWIASDG